MHGRVFVIVNIDGYVGIFFFDLLQIYIFCFVVEMCDLVHEVKTAIITVRIKRYLNRGHSQTVRLLVIMWFLLGGLPLQLGAGERLRY